MKVEGKFTFKTETNAFVFGLQGSLKGDSIPCFYDNNVAGPESNGDPKREDTSQSYSLVPKGLGFNFDANIEIRL